MVTPGIVSHAEQIRLPRSARNINHERTETVVDERPKEGNTLDLGQGQKRPG